MPRLLLLLILLAAPLALACGDSVDDQRAAAPSTTAELLETPVAQPTATSDATSIAPAFTPTSTESPTATPAEQTSTPTQEVPTIEAIYAQLAQTLASASNILHSTSTFESDAGLYSMRGTVEQWVDADLNVVRRDAESEMTQDPEHTHYDATTIIADNVQHAFYREPEQRTDIRSPQSCYDASVIVSTVLACPGPNEESDTTVEWGTYAGHAVLVLVTEGGSWGEDESETFVKRLYLAADSALPIAEETDGELNYGVTVPMLLRINWQHEFVSRDDFPADFFDVAALANA